MYSHLEDYIYKLFTSIGVENPTDLDMKFIAKQLGVKIVYKQRAFRFDDEILLVRGTKYEEWMLFGHEICHFLRHCGSQLKMHPLFIDLQEYQANYFAYHFCVPTFMLDKLFNYTVYDIVNLFNVDYDFAQTRLNMHESKRLQNLNHRQISSMRIAETASSYETAQVMDSDILNEEFYETFNLEINATEKIKETIGFWHYIKRRKIR